MEARPPRPSLPQLAIEPDEPGFDFADVAPAPGLDHPRRLVLALPFHLPVREARVEAAPMGLVGSVQGLALSPLHHELVVPGNAAPVRARG